MNLYPLTTLISLTPIAMSVRHALRVATARQTYADQHDDQGLFHSPQIY